MNSKILSHPMFLHAPDIATICQPLKKLNITYFCHVHIDKHKKFSAICNNTGFANHYLKNKYYNADIHLANTIIPGNFVVWDMLERIGNSAKMHQEAKQFGIQHTFTIIQEGGDGKNYYHFANNSSSRSINHIYLANLDLLLMFIDYFKENISQSRELKYFYQFKYSIDKKPSGYTIKSPEKLILTKEAKLEFTKLITNEKNDVSIVGNVPANLQLSPQKMKCLMLLLAGKTSKQIARQMQLSYRTIEHYLSDIRHKFNCKNSKDLITYYYSTLLDTKNK